VRERRGLAYSVGSGYGYLADAGIFTISAGVNRENVAETINVCLAETAKLCNERVPADELTRAKDHATGRFRLSLETAHAVAQRHGELLLTRNRIETIDEAVAQMEAVTAEDVRDVAERLLSPGGVHCAVVGPNVDEDELRRAIAA
jgi:predicted Zn-dependent peptidase